MMNKIFSAVCLAWCFFSVRAQEIQFPLSNNPVIKEYIRKNAKPSHATERMSGQALPLPFQDDFAYEGIFPSTQLWVDSDAFVNQTVCHDPITIGVATLDGIDKEGNPHDSLSTSVQPVICDYLTSQPIDLSTTSFGDSVYFSFYYQPQGLGDEPENGDSLVLQFYANDGVDSTWLNVWVANGRPDSAFSAVRIKLDSAYYFWSGFQFRFYNYATPNGNRDHWHIDHVNLDKNQSFLQPLNEITLVYPIGSYLTEFTAMPYSHYKQDVLNGNNPVKSSVVDTFRVHELTGSASVSMTFSVNDRQGNNIFSQTVSDAASLNVNEFTDYALGTGLPNALFTSTIADFTDFYITHYITTTQSGWAGNDSARKTQHFYNYYAYDDGTAESATGVHVAYTKYAYQFDVKKADSLLGISIYFNPWGKNVHQDLFSLCLWSNVNVQSNTDVLVYQEIDKKPANNDSINGFVDYYFDTAQWVQPGVQYIGIIQSSINEIGIGVDHNTDSHDKMFLSFNNQWYQSTITGSWMMRPIFHKELTIGVKENGMLSFEMFPNPANKGVVIETPALSAGSVVVIFNLLGEQLMEFPIAAGETVTRLEVSDLPAGVYFVQVSGGKDTFSAVKKLVIQR